MAFYNRFLFVCTGNTCRSPMAAALFRKMAADRGLPIVAVSAGLAAQSGSPASENAVKALAEEGIDLSRHLSKPVTRELCDEAQMIAVMSEHHRLALVAADVDPHKIFVLGGGVPDPYGGSLDVYRDTRDALKAVLPALLPPFRIVKMNESHIPALAALEKECFSQPWSETGLSTELQNDTAVFLVAENEQGEPLGLLGMHHILDECDIAQVAVRQDCRRQGVGFWLLSAAADYAAKNGVVRLMLETRQSNEPARTLYQKFGFVEDGYRPRFYEAPVEDAVLYSYYLEKDGEQP